MPARPLQAARAQAEQVMGNVMVDPRNRRRQRTASPSVVPPASRGSRCCGAPIGPGGRPPPIGAIGSDEGWAALTRGPASKDEEAASCAAPPPGACARADGGYGVRDAACPISTG